MEFCGIVAAFLSEIGSLVCLKIWDSCQKQVSSCNNYFVLGSIKNVPEDQSVMSWQREVWVFVFLSKLVHAWWSMVGGSQPQYTPASISEFRERSIWYWMWMTVPYLVLSFYWKGKCTKPHGSRIYNLEPQAQSLWWYITNSVGQLYVFTLWCSLKMGELQLSKALLRCSYLEQYDNATKLFRFG
jgi:hypothetical protein